jgi:hypothetical protein
MCTTERPRVELASRAHPAGVLRHSTSRPPRARPRSQAIAFPTTSSTCLAPLPPALTPLDMAPLPTLSPTSASRRLTRLPLATSRSHAPTFPRVTHRASRRLPPCHPPVRRAAPTRQPLASSLPRRVSPAPRAATLRRRTPTVRLTATTRPPPPLASHAASRPDAGAPRAALQAA